MQFLTTLLPLLLAPLATAQIPCFQTYGWIQEITFLSTEETHYLPQIYLKKIQTATTPNVTICDGQYPFHANPDQPDFIPGGIPTNTSFAGPWGAFNCSDPYWQVDVNGIDGNILVKYNEDATYVEAGAANWLQVATAEGVAGFPDQRISVWEWDSRDVGCGA